MFCTFTLAHPAVCSAQCGCFLQLLNFVPSRYVAQVPTKWFWGGSSRPCYNRYHFCIYSPHALNFYHTVFILRSSQLLFWSHFSVCPEIATSVNIHLPFSLSLIMLSGLLLGMVLLVCICWLRDFVNLHLQGFFLLFFIYACTGVHYLLFTFRSV